MRKLVKHLDNRIEIYFASVFLLVFTFLTILQVIMRYVFNNPLSWSEELARFAFIWFVYISGSYAVKFQRHVRLSFVDKLPQPLNLVFQMLALLIWLSFLIFVDIYSFEVISLMYTSNQYSPANHIPIYIMYYSVALGAILMSIRVIQHVVKKAKQIVRYFKKDQSAISRG